MNNAPEIKSEGIKDILNSVHESRLYLRHDGYNNRFVPVNGSRVDITRDGETITAVDITQVMHLLSFFVKAYEVQLNQLETKYGIRINQLEATVMELQAGIERSNSAVDVPTPETFPHGRVVLEVYQHA